jgi:hypothetical protein
MVAGQGLTENIERTPLETALVLGRTVVLSSSLGNHGLWSLSGDGDRAPAGGAAIEALRNGISRVSGGILGPHAIGIRGATDHSAVHER